MKKQQNNSTHAWALHVALSIALLSISAVLLASGFRASPATKGLSAFSAPAAAGHKEPTLEQLASIPSLPAVDAPFTFNNTGSLTTARLIHTATLLNNGKVLVAGGTPDFNTPLSSAELYDPASGTWTATGTLNTARFFHTATLLPNGKVLVAGGHLMAVATVLKARNCTIRPAGCGLPQATSTPHAPLIRRQARNAGPTAPATGAVLI